ncbi:MAG: chromosome segregation protein SMC [Firmicutes bacterium]|nr:chromosome segregation protein SMC [Bacillota bacterium]
MYFKRLEMHGFKSFAEPVVIEFHEGVTCIVGPNGSGKSNISDAIRWVLGEQSPKMLRGGKMEEVIFAGTASRKSRGMAEVTLVIDNATGILPIDYNEVAITRRMYRSGESEYLINNNQCRLRDIRELIMDTGIGVDGYSIIGQGKIADIVSNKPESRREIFEEAAGVVLYKSKKAEAERKLEGTSANLERVNDIVGEIEGRIDGLREDSQKATEYLTLKERYRELEINITLRNIEKLDSSNETLRKDIEEFTASIETLTKEKGEMDKQLTESRQKNVYLEQLGNEAQDKLMAKVEELHRLESQSQLNEERISGIDKDMNRLEEEIHGLDEKLLRELSNLKNLEEEKGQIGENMAGAEELLAEKIEKYNQVSAKAAAISDAIDKDKDQIFKLHSQVADKKAEARSIETYQETLQKRKQQLLQDQQDMEANAQKFETILADAQREKKAADEMVETLLTSLAEARTDRESYLAETRALSKRQEELRLTSMQLSSRKKTIEEMEHNYEGYNGAVRYIMRGRRAGIHGVVADLMKVPQGYEVAVETALGGAMQNIVCDGDEDAKAAIRSLKENKAGRCTFLPLGSVKGRKADVERRVEQVEGYLGLAADCIKYDKKYENIFHYLLGRVAIVDDMDHAVSLSKMAGTSGLRFVTLEGEIINASGAITGGKYKNATANLLERKQEIFRLEEQLAKMKKETAEIHESLEEMEETIEEMSDVIADTERDYRQAELNAANIDTRIQTLMESSKDIHSGREKAERELASIVGDFANAKSMIEGYHREAQEMETQIQRHNLSVEENMKTWEEVKKQVNEANEEITKARIAKSEWDNKLESYLQMMKRVKETADDLQFQIDDKRGQTEKLDKEKNTILFGSKGAVGQAETTEKERKELEEYINTVRQERADLTETIDKMTAAHEQALEKLNHFQDQKYQMEIKMTRNETQLDTFKEKLWEDFEVSYPQAVELRKEDFAVSTASRESREIRNRMKELGDVNVGAIKEYEQVSQRYEFLTEQRSDILTAMGELKSIVADMDKTIKEKFKNNFDQVVINFEEIFKQLFGGGHAELRLDDENNPLETGIEIIAQPPGKKLQNINLMSGGEKTMTAIALMFAVLKTKPTPFCILDEVEAALDDANIDRFATYLKNFHNIQFAIVTHQKATMEHADVLYGVTMPEQGISKVLSLRLGDDFEM